MTEDMNAVYIAYWERRIIEINETGNCKNKLGQDYFSGGKFTTEMMIFFCESMIDRLRGVVMVVNSKQK